MKTHHYIISFDPKDAVENGLTMERAQALGLQFCKDNFPGHPAIVCTHPDGHNHSGNIHVHIVIGSIRTREVERKPYMQKPRDWLEGMKHSSTAQTMRHLRVEVMELCEGAGLYQIDLLNSSKERVSEAEKKAAKIFRGNQYTLAKKSGGDHGDNHHSGKKTCDRIAEENGVSRASVLRASHYTRGIDIADNLSPGIKQKVFSGEVKFTNEEMSKLVQASVEHRSDVLAQILHPEALEVLESASAEFEPEKAEPVPMPTPQTEEFRCYHVPDEFMKVYKSLSRATEMMKNSWKKTLKNNPSYFTDPEKQKVLRFAMQRPANYLTEIETYLEKALAEALEEEKTA